MTLDEMVAQYGESTVARWAKTGWLVEKVLPDVGRLEGAKLVYDDGSWHPHGQRAPVWFVDQRFSDESQMGDLSFLSETVGHGDTALAALEAADA